MKSKANYQKSLPRVNTSSEFIILEESLSTLGEDWFEFASFMLESALDENVPHFSHLNNTLKGNTNIFNLPCLSKTILGIGCNFNVININYAKMKVNIALKMGYPQLISIYREKPDMGQHSGVIRSTVDKFFAYQWSKGKLLFPLYIGSDKYHRHNSWNYFVEQTPLSLSFSKWADDKQTDRLQKIIRKANFNALITTTKWKKSDDVDEESITMMQKYIEATRQGRSSKIGKFLRVVNDFRLFLIAQGHIEIKPPIDVHKINEKKIQRDEHGNVIHFYDFVDTDRYPNLKNLVEYGDGFARRLNADGLSIKSINMDMNESKKLLFYLIEYHPHDIIDNELIVKIFDPTNPNNIVDVLAKSKENGRNYAISIVNRMVKFLVHCELFSEKARKYIPRRKKKTGIEPYRSAMPQQMVRDILEILKTRPPSSKTIWEKSKADLTWWKHDEYPVFPMMLLFHYYIPLRGNQIRHLCREASFIYNDEGNIDTFVINTDKNVNRKYLQEIPCVWDDLQIYTSFLAWHREYFPHLPKIRYQNDPNSPWEDIEPLMILPNTLKPISNNTHISYHKKVICQYQIEIKQKAEEAGLDTYPIVAWSKTKQPFFESVEELNNASTTRMRDIGVMYDIHSLRVTGATRYLESGVGLATVMELTGHMSSETLMRVYIRLTRKEKEEKLKTAIQKIYMGAKEELIENSHQFIQSELTDAFNDGEESMEQSFKDNGLFSIHKKATFNDDKNVNYELGTSIATKKHPTSWIPMIHGICPAIKCPDGREHKCSLCPYLITGKLFIDGVVHRHNRAFAEFQRDSLVLKEEEKKGYTNHSLSEGLETKLEEILGWQAIMSKIENSLQEESDSEGEQDVIAYADKVFAAETTTTDLVYLKNAYDAQQLGVEQDIFGLQSLTIRAIQIAVKMGESDKVEMLAQDETKAIDMLMEYYKHEQIERDSNATKLVTSIGMLPKPK